jgi:hypothetical protein
VASSGEELGGGAGDFLAHQATQPAYSLGEEGRKLAGTRSAYLRAHLTQSGGLRIESKVEAVTITLTALAVKFDTFVPEAKMMLDKVWWEGAWAFSTFIHPSAWKVEFSEGRLHDLP